VIQSTLQSLHSGLGTPVARTQHRTRHGAHTGISSMAAGLLLLFPEIAVGLLLFDAVKAAHLHRFDGDDPERGDAIQWVIVTAIGAAIAVTVGAIIFNKLETKANNIDVTTPGAR
jgi:hypothetical protein